MSDQERLESLFHECAVLDRSDWGQRLAGLADDERSILLAMLDSDDDLQKPGQSGFLSVQKAAQQDFQDQSTMHGFPSVSTQTANRPSAVSTDETPKQIGDYHILNTIAIHGQGAVYRANHPHLNRQVVIKVSKNQIDPAAQQHVLSEGQALAALSHPNLAQVYDLQFDRGFPYLVMEYIDGRNLAEQLKGKPLSVGKTVELVATLADAIHHANSRGIIHRDLKPANIVIRAADEVPKIIDFGLARTRNAYIENELTSNYGGTIAYMAPEQALQLRRPANEDAVDRCDERVDVFALGAILYETLTGKRLFEFSSVSEGLEQAIACDFDASLLDDVPPKIRDACLKALAKDPSDRWSNAAEFATALQQSKPKPQAVAQKWIVAVLAATTLFALGWLALGPDETPGELPGKPKTIVNQDDQVAQISPEPNQPSGAANPTDMQVFQPDPLVDVLAEVRFTHHANSRDQKGGPLFAQGSVCEDDDLRINAKFDVPTYCFLFAVNPDGAVQLCYPEASEDYVQPKPVRAIDYPADPESGFGFTDGAGQQAFVLVKSSEPLPSFQEWRGSIGNLQESIKGITGEWSYQDGDATSVATGRATRGAPRKLRGVEAFKTAMQALESANANQEVLGITFPVRPRSQSSQ